MTSLLVEPIPAEETELSTLARDLQRSEGFVLFFVRCNQPAHQHRLADAIRADSPCFPIHEIHLTAAVPHLLDELRARLAEPPGGAVLVSGLEYSLPNSSDAHRMPLVANLNAARDSFPGVVPCPLVLLVPDYALAAIERGAPEFFAMRYGVYSFAAAAEATDPLVSSVTPGEPWSMVNLPEGEREERVTAMRSSLDEYRALPPERRDHHAEMRLLQRLGVMNCTLGRWAEAEQDILNCLEITRQRNDREAEATALNSLGKVYESQRRLEEAETAYQHSLTLGPGSGDRLSEARARATTLINLGQLYQSQERWPEAEAVLLDSLKIDRELHNRTGQEMTLGQLGAVYQSQERWSEAETACQDSLNLASVLGDRVSEGNGLDRLGGLYHAQGRWGEAACALNQSLLVWRELGNPVGEGRALRGLAMLAGAQGDLPGALEFARQAVCVLASTEDAENLADAGALVAKLGG